MQLIQPGDDSRRNWRQINELIIGAEKLKLPGQSQAAILAGLIGRQRDPGTPFHPYQGSTWLKWYVSTGYLVTNGNPIVPSQVDVEFTLTSGVPYYWFWLDVEAQEVKTTDTTLEWTARKIPLCWVDTDTQSAEQIATAVSLVNWHIVTLCP
ncbi:MAG: hypothetical protein E6R03_15970 [Hyphomicrobiaceae bacterium]|nr:MAG: hypothetical protein E6R03_15970 [Hyphomicrobiaceae bacterium]